MSDEYDPDSFDWGEDAPGIVLDSTGVDTLEQLLQAALNNHEERFGWRYLKKSAREEGSGRLFRVKYYMPEEKRAFFEEHYPGYTFVWDGALGHHDHPVANLTTELGELEMVEPLVKDGVQYIDLFGNGRRDRRYKRNCFNMFALATPKDYIRYQNRGVNDIPFSLEKLCDKEGLYGKINNVTLTHALYYLTMEDIGRIVNVSSGRRLSALIHRHSSSHGWLNSGEQEYWVSPEGVVTQRNVSTGEYYTHPTLEPLFHQFSAQTASGGVAWTVRAAGGDNFIVEFVGCPKELCAVFKDVQVLKKESWEEYEYNSVRVCKLWGWTWMSASTESGMVSLEDTELMDKLRRYVAGKARTARLKAETFNYAKRLCNKLDIISVHGGGAHNVRVGSLKDYVEVAFRIDMRSEADIALSFYKEDKAIIQVLNSYIEKGDVPRDFTAITHAVNVSVKTVTDAAAYVLEDMRRAHETRLMDGGGSHERIHQPELGFGLPGYECPGVWK